MGNPKSWALGRAVGLYKVQIEEGQDVRHLVCLKCNLDFCSLCGNKWNDRKTSHMGKSCIEHSSYLPEKCAAEIRWTGAKPCPGCGVPIQRSMGCNHMTCTQCRREWCWVCSDTWTPAHYSCTPERSARNHDACSVQ